jgi:hypothetical protein
MILSPKDYEFKIQLSDTKDGWGLPDVLMESCEFKPLKN